MELRFPVILDGATGTQLQKRGFDGSCCAEKWTLEHPEAILEIQRSYVEAGSNILYTPTFGANRVKLESRGLFNKVEEYNLKLAALSREAADGKALVAVDMGPTSEFMAPVGMYKAEDFIKTFFDQAASAKEAGADFAMIETQTDLAEARCALLGVKKAGMEAAVSFTFENGKTLTGSSPECCR